MPGEENKEVSVVPKNSDLGELKQKIAELPEEDRIQIYKKQQTNQSGEHAR